MSNVYISTWRLFLLAICIALGFSGILGRLYYLHIWDQEKLAKIVKTNRNKIEIIHSRRGKVVDTRGNLLATTITIIELGVDPHVIKPEDFNKLSDLSHLIGLPLKELEARIAKKTRERMGDFRREITNNHWSKLADKIDETDYNKVIELGIKGVYGNRKFERIYPGDSLAAHLVGFLNKDANAVMGVERYMDFYLRGRSIL